MPFPFKISVVGLGVLTTMQATPSIAWNYADTAAAEWATGTCAAEVSAQSPINVRVAAVAEASAQTPPQAYNFDWEGAPDSADESAIQGGLVINDHTLELEWDVNDAATNKYGLKIGDKLYRLRQFHYHSPSEHTVDGNHYDMEAHHVHFCEGVSCATDDPDDEILVVAVFMSVGSANDYLTTFWERYTAGAEPSVAGLPNPYLQFMPSDKSYYSYVGSTTTPPCAQNVQWMLLTQQVELSQEQLTAYHQKVNELVQPATPNTQPTGVSTGWDNSWKTNNRPVQELGDRTVLHFVPPPAADEESSFPVLPLLAALAALALLTAGVCVWLNQSKKPAKNASRAAKTKPPPPAPKEAPKEETVPLMPPPLMAAPNLSMVVPAQPLMQAVPQAYTTAARPVAMAPYGQAPMILQP